ncbi:MAG: hypothetical protein IJT31_06525 [Oscillibacter sp.]|nr:hypothetical protein [Oscillibacter sp.]
MLKDKSAEFFDALYAFTKSRRITWKPLLHHVHDYPGDGDGEHSFMTMFESGSVILVGSPIGLLREKADGAIKCFVMALGNPLEQIGAPNEPALLRLYNFITGVPPDVEPFVDAVILEAKAST